MKPTSKDDILRPHVEQFDICVCAASPSANSYDVEDHYEVLDFVAELEFFQIRQQQIISQRPIVRRRYQQQLNVDIW